MKNTIEMPQNSNEKAALQNIFDNAPTSVDKWGDERNSLYKVRFFFNNNRSQLEYVWVKAAGVCDAQSILIKAAKDLNLDCTILGADNMGLINPPIEVETVTIMKNTINSVKILDFIISNNGATTKQIADHFELPTSAIAGVLEKMFAFDIINHAPCLNEDDELVPEWIAA